MAKRAAIYIRVSTERQAEKVSPQAQEDDCLKYCKAHDYRVVDVYRDIEKYRSNGRLVEPSGTRSDRPHFLRMLADIDTERVDIVIAWREDRLYRNVNKAMLEISERVSQNKVTVELVKEHYDASTAVVKAWAAGIELKAKRDRVNMGIAGKLAKEGGNWLSVPPYGYNRTSKGEIVIDEVEAPWVRRMWEWYAAGLPGREIRRRLIEGGAPQRKASKYSWSLANIYQYLRYEPYHTGIVITNWDGEQFPSEIPPIVDQNTAQAASKRRAAFKRHPSGNLKAHALASGLVYCQSCGRKMQVISRKVGEKLYLYYKCIVSHNLGERPDGCAGSVKMARVDDEIWARVWRVIESPDEFNAAMRDRIAQLQAQEIDAGAECEKLERQLGEITFERQKVITWARKGIITDGDLEIQIATLDEQKKALLHDLQEARLLVGGHADKLMELANLFTAEVRAGMAEVSAVLPEGERKARQVEYRRKIINAIVSRVYVYPDKSIQVHTEWNLPQLCGDSVLCIGELPPRWQLTDIQNLSVSLLL